MDNQILHYYSKISNLYVSRETCNELERLIAMIQEKNKEINIISREIYEKEQIRERHIIDSAQIIDFVDLNSNTTSDLGSGGGLPGLIVAIVMKKIKNSMKVNLYEKSHHKCEFLRDVSKKLSLNTEIIHNDIFKIKNTLSIASIFYYSIVNDGALEFYLWRCFLSIDRKAKNEKKI